MIVVKVPNYLQYNVKYICSTNIIIFSYLDILYIPDINFQLPGLFMNTSCTFCKTVINTCWIKSEVSVDNCIGWYAKCPLSVSQWFGSPCIRMCKYLKFREYFILTNQKFSKLLSFPKTKETVKSISPTRSDFHLGYSKAILHAKASC